jgi:hypothetical protein
VVRLTETKIFSDFCDYDYTENTIFNAMNYPLSDAFESVFKLAKKKQTPAKPAKTGGTRGLPQKPTDVIDYAKLRPEEEKVGSQALASVPKPVGRGNSEARNVIRT